MRPSHVLSALLVSTLLTGAAYAQAEGPSERTLGTTADGKRIVSIVIYGDDPCPEGDSGEIVVCARQPEADRYRLPKQFRKPDSAKAGSWAARASAADSAGSASIGSCSAVGSGGATGCNRQMMRAAREERKQQQAKEAEVAEEISNP